MRVEKQIPFDEISDKEPGDYGLYRALQIGNKHIDVLVSLGGVLMSVDEKYLQGTQDYEEYSSSKSERIDRILGKYGLEYLKTHPLITCSLFSGDRCNIAIVDGHHRKRRGPLFGIRKFPSLVVPPSVIASFTNSLRGREVTNEVEVFEFYSRAIPNAKESFLRKSWSNLYDKGPNILGRSVIGATNIHDLDLKINES